EGIAFETPYRVAVPEVDLPFAEVIVSVQVDETRVVNVLRVDRHEIARLDDLERERQIHQVRNARLVAARERIGGRVRAIRVALREPFGRVRNPAVRRVDDYAEAGGHAVARAMRLDVVVRCGIEDLPDALEVGLSESVSRR